VPLGYQRGAPRVISVNRGFAYASLTTVAALLMGGACASDMVERADSTLGSYSYVRRADAVCERGREHLRSDPAARSSTAVIVEMERELRELGELPHALDEIAGDPVEVLARVTWAAESFNVAGRYDIGSGDVTVKQLRSLGFRVCGTQ